MPNPGRPANISFDIAFKKEKASGPIDEEASLRIAVLGNFRGHSGGELTARPNVRVDCDNFESFCAQLGATLRLSSGAVGESDVDLRFKSLDDFHPDQLLKNVPALAKLTQLRARLLNPSTADDASTELRGILAGSPAEPGSPAASASEPEESAAETLARLLGNPSPSAAKPARPAAPASVVDRLLRQAVSPTASAAPSAEQVQLLAMLDAELATRLRQILHHPDFQAIESTWRGLDFLVRESNESVEIHVIDVSREELERQLGSEVNPAATSVGRQLERIAPFVILCPWSFGSSDVAAIQNVALLAAACGTAIIASGASDLVGCDSFGSHPDSLDWTDARGPDAKSFAELRRAPEAAHLGLTTPRFVLRAPYGQESEPIETFPFEELPGGGPHESYLWGSSALLCGRWLINAFAENGWEMELGGVGGEIGGLPVHSFKADGETQVKPCAEAWLSERAADAILQHGLMPVLSVRGSDSAILVSLRSISDPALPLEFRVG